MVYIYPVVIVSPKGQDDFFDLSFPDFPHLPHVRGNTLVNILSKAYNALMDCLKAFERAGAETPIPSGVYDAAERVGITSGMFVTRVAVDTTIGDKMSKHYRFGAMKDAITDAVRELQSVSEIETQCEEEVRKSDVGDGRMVFGTPDEIRDLAENPNFQLYSGKIVISGNDAIANGDTLRFFASLFPKERLVCITVMHRGRGIEDLREVRYINELCHALHIQHRCVSDGDAGLDIIHQICDCGIPIENDKHQRDVLMAMEEDVTDAFLNAATEAMDGVCIRVDNEEA